MKKQINEIKRMQLLAGLITESEYRESQMNEAKETISVSDAKEYADSWDDDDISMDFKKTFSGKDQIAKSDFINFFKKHIDDMSEMSDIRSAWDQLLSGEGLYETKMDEAYSNKRVNYRDEETATPDVVNHLFDTIDIVPLDNGNKLQITTTYYYRDPGVKGYDVNSLSEDNPDVSKVRAILLDPSGRKLSSKTFTSPFLIKMKKSYFIPQIVASFENK